MTIQEQAEPQVNDGARPQAPAMLWADPELRVQPVLSLEMPARSLRPAITKAMRFSAIIMGGVLAVILLSFMVETN